MKTTITLLLLSITLQITSANKFDCGLSGLSFLPSQKEISLNSMFIIEGYEYSQKTIESFKKRTVFLEDKNGETVQLILRQILKGQMSLNQAIFIPKKELKPNTKYFLKISNLTNNEKMDFVRWNSKTGDKEEIFWKTSNKKQGNELSIDLIIEFEKTKVVYYGCGPSSNAIFKVKNKKASEIWFKTEVIDLSTNIKTIYFIREWQGNLNVGHGMCSGAFKFNRKGKYKVRFTPMNTDGKMNKTTKWITFNSPYENQKGSGF